MITIIHGEDIGSSRKYLAEQKAEVQNFYSFDAEQFNLTDFVQIIEGGSLFTEDKNIFIENLLLSKRGQNELIAYIKDHANDANIVLWDAKELSKKVLSEFPKVKIQLFKYPQQLFLFLDSLKPQNGSIISLFHILLKTHEPELLFFMITRQIRILLFLKEAGSEQIDEIIRMSPWQITKLKKQATLFTKSQLVTSFNKLFQIEYGMKTGTLSIPLVASIDFFLADL